MIYNLNDTINVTLKNINYEKTKIKKRNQIIYIQETHYREWVNDSWEWKLGEVCLIGKIVRKSSCYKRCMERPRSLVLKIVGFGRLVKIVDFR